MLKSFLKWRALALLGALLSSIAIDFPLSGFAMPTKNLYNGNLTSNKSFSDLYNSSFITNEKIYVINNNYDSEIFASVNKIINHQNIDTAISVLNTYHKNNTKRSYQVNAYATSIYKNHNMIGGCRNAQKKFIFFNIFKYRKFKFFKNHCRFNIYYKLNKTKNNNNKKKNSSGDSNAIIISLKKLHFLQPSICYESTKKVVTITKSRNLNKIKQLQTDILNRNRTSYYTKNSTYHYLLRTDRSIYSKTKKNSHLHFNGTNLDRNERSTNLSHISGPARKIQLYIKNRFLQLLPDGTVNGTHNDLSDYTILQRTTVDVGQIKIQGVATCLYLCMDPCGLAYGSKVFTDDCVFNESMEQHHYNTYSSTFNSNSRRVLYLALNRHGQPRKLQIPATRSLGKLAIYTKALTETVPQERVENLITKIFGHNRVKHGLRQLCDTGKSLVNLTAPIMREQQKCNIMNITTSKPQQSHHHHHKHNSQQVPLQNNTNSKINNKNSNRSGDTNSDSIKLNVKRKLRKRIKKRRCRGEQENNNNNNNTNSNNCNLNQTTKKQNSRKKCNLDNVLCNHSGQITQNKHENATNNLNTETQETNNNNKHKSHVNGRSGRKKIKNNSSLTIKSNKPSENISYDKTKTNITSKSEQISERISEIIDIVSSSSSTENDEIDDTGSSISSIEEELDLVGDWNEQHLYDKDFGI